MTSIVQIRTSIEKLFAAVLKDNEKLEIVGNINEEAYGHTAGIPTEDWAKTRLEAEFTIYYPNEILLEIFKLFKNEKDIKNFLETVWWSKLLFTNQQLVDFLNEKEVKRWQQEGADLVLFYGKTIAEDSEKVILINVKAHNSLKESRPPNIMSAQRLLEFFNYTLLKSDSKRRLEQMELLFLGVDYTTAGDQATVNNIHIKDLFKLDVTEIPQINFDAAIQIQWHVKDMKEIKQTKKEFILKLSNEFIKRWNHHSSAKQEKYEELVKNIKSKLI